MNQLRKCQTEAIKCFEKYFFEDDEDEHDRGIISMCCGAGKTRTTYEIIKLCSIKYNCKFFIYATSRIGLIYQTSKDFRDRITDDNLDMEVRIVGGSGEEDRDITLSSINNIKDAISSKINDNKSIVIITTYTSSGKIISAVNGDKKYYPDLIILDEAHNTTGDNEKNNQKLIEKGNDSFSSERYLFLTATPVQLALKDKNSSFNNIETTYSMPNKKIYGDIVYEYSFKDGADDGVILPFKTIYLSQKNKIPPEIQRELKGKTKKEKADIYYKTISNFLMKSIRDYNLKFVLVYCKNTDKMKLMEDWVNILWEGVFDYKIFSISSTHGKIARRDTRKSFRENDGIPHILLSVGIFDEGIDEPCIDSVFFAEERHTESRIVQNIGRCLRIDKNNPQKKVGYVLVPNIVINIDDNDDDTDVDIDIDDIEDNDDIDNKNKKHQFKEISNSFSSYFKSIRTTCSIMQKPVRRQFYKKMVKGKLPDLSDSDDDDKVDQCDKIINEENTNIDPMDNGDHKNKDEILDIFKFLTSKWTDGTIANEKLQNLKELKRKNNISTLSQWGKFCETNRKLYVCRELHKVFRSEWICWGDFLFDETFSYADVKKLFANELKGTFKTKDEWIKYYHDIINNELNYKRDSSISDDLVNSILKIPGRPQEYYKEDWVDWNDFLGLNDPITIGIIKNGTGIEAKADKNISTLVNKDHEISNKFVNGEYNNIDIPDEYTNAIKKYIDESLGVDSMLQVRVATKRNGNYDKCCINCRINNQKEVPIVIYPEENKCRYDPNAIRSISNKVNRNTDIYVQNSKIIDQFDKIIGYIKNFVKNNKSKKIEQKYDGENMLVKNGSLKKIPKDTFDVKPSGENSFKNKPTKNASIEKSLTKVVRAKKNTSVGKISVKKTGKF